MKRQTMWIALFAMLASSAFAERSNVFFIHGANVTLEGEQIWAEQMFKRLWQAGADMNFIPISWESDIGPSYNYQVNVSNAFVVAMHLGPAITETPGRNVIIAHSLGTVVGAAAIQDYGARVDKFIMLNSAIPSEAFDPSLADLSPANKLVHDEWTGYTNACWTAQWHALFATNDARSRLTWRGRFANVARVAVNFYSSGDEVLEIYPNAHNPGWYNGFSPSGHWGERYSWHKQELYKGRKSLLGFIGTTEWSGWGFKKNALGFKAWSADDANAVADPYVFVTNTVFNPYPASITNAVASRLETDFHLAQGIPALSPPTGRTRFSPNVMPCYDMSDYKANGWPRPPAAVGSDDLGDNWLHSDIKDIANFYTYKLFDKIVEEGGLK